MTGDTGNASLAAVLSSTGPILLDFDGPVTPLMPDGIDCAIADAMRDVLRRMTGGVPANVADTKDPLTVLRVAAGESAEVLAAVEDACRAGEVDAAERSEPTDGAHEAMWACRDAGRPLIIVSNNAPEAIEAYLDRHDLASLVQVIAARPPGRPDLMKPDPYLIRQVLRVRADPPSRYAFIGDSVTDAEVSVLTNIQCVGYAKTTQRGQDLRAAGATALIDSMADLADALRRVRPAFKRGG